MSSERYELAQDDLGAVLEKIESSIDLMNSRKNYRSRRRMNPEEQRQLVTRCRSELNDAKGLVKEMEQEARVAPSQYRNSMLTRVNHFRDEMSRLQKALMSFSDGSLTNLNNVNTNQIGEEGLAAPELTADERLRQQVMQGKNALERTSQSLARSQQVAIETEEIGEAIVDDLGVQRESLERSRARLQDTNAEISRGGRVLTRLKMATLHNKIILGMIIVIEIGIICCIIYWKWFKK